MFKNEYTLTVDLKKSMSAVAPKFVQYDNATLVFKILDNGKNFDLTGFTKAEVAHKRPDGVTVIGTANIESTTNGKSVIRYNYLGSEMHKEGYTEVSLSVFSEDKKVSIYPFKVEIVKDIRDEVLKDAKEEVGLLQELIAEVSDILDQAHTAIDSANNAVEIATQATTDATTAIVNANLAITNAQNAAVETIQVKDDTLLAKEEAELATINANKIVNSFTHKGEHNMSDSYVERNIVNFDGGSYIAIQNSTGISPTDTSYWKLIAKKGETGAQGIQGVRGQQGERGETGKGFSIAKTYPSVAAMFADYNNPQIPIGSFVLINTADVNNVENAMMYVKGETEYKYLTDLSGAQGIRGERGERGLQGIQGIQGERGAPGEKGETGLGFNWKGTYSNTISYSLNDVVSYNGSSYVALQNTLGNLPTDTASWNMVSQRGVDGEGSVSSVNGIFPDVDGNVTLDLGDTITSIDGFLPNENGNVVTHANKPVLDALTDDTGQLKYKGNPVGRVTSVNGQTGDVTVQGFSGSYNDLTEVPVEFKPEAHNHPINEVTGLSTELAKKVDKVTGKGLSTEDYTTAEKTKLSSIANNANNYVHPTNHPASVITQDSNNRFVTDTEKTTWNAKASTSVATTSTNGLMSSTDKTKLNGIETGAQVNSITSVNGQTGVITGLATNQSVDNKIGLLNDGINTIENNLTDHSSPSKQDAHVISNITGLQSALDSKSTFSGNYNDLKDKPATENLNALNTTDKTSLVNAINEINAKPGGGSFIKFDETTFNSSNQNTSIIKNFSNFSAIRIVFNNIGRVNNSSDTSAWAVGLQLGTAGEANTHVQSTISGNPTSVSNTRLTLLNISLAPSIDAQRRIQGLIDIKCDDGIYYTESMLWFPGNWQSDATGGGNLVTNHTMVRGWRTTARVNPLEMIQLYFTPAIIAYGTIEYWGIPNE